MDKQRIEELILRVFSEYEKRGKEPEKSRECPLDIPVEVSARHVHLTDEAVEALFGRGAVLTPKRPLSQPGQYLSEERVTVITPKGRLENVAVLGPTRAAVQTELSASDCRSLGISAPLRLSGDLSGAADVYILGPCGMISAPGSAIIAQAHVHITPDEARAIRIRDGQRVSVTLKGERQISLENVICRVSSQAALAMHIDFDEANACLLPKNATARIRVMEEDVSGRDGEWPRAAAVPFSAREYEPEKQEPEKHEPETRERSKRYEGRLLTEEGAFQAAAEKPVRLLIEKGTIVTPSAKDVLRHAGIELVICAGR